MSLTLIAGVEIAHGSASGFAHGHIDDRHVYGDPVALVERHLAGGARWVHVGDLDALAGRGENAAAVRAVVHACRGRAQVALAGGIRDDASLRAALAGGARQVLLDPAALADPDFVATAVAMPRVGVSVVSHGLRLWAPGSPVDGTDVLEHLAELDRLGCRSFVVDDIDSRGARTSSGRATLVAASGLVSGALIAAGGVDRLEDLHALADAAIPGLTGVVIDRALASGAFTLAEAEAAIEPRFDPYEWGPPRP